MTFEKFKKEVARDMYSIDEIAMMAADVEDKEDLVFISQEYLSKISDAESVFMVKLKGKVKLKG